MSNIIFNNKNYSIDDSAFATHSNALKSHFSSVMNGSGAVINFDGTAYNIDSAKLSAAKDAFVAHLGTIAGSGHKVVVGGVEYGIDSSEVAGTVAGLETVLGGLISGGGEGQDELPEETVAWYSYNGIEAPSIDEIWDKEAYPYVTMDVVPFEDAYVVGFCFTSEPWQYRGYEIETNGVEGYHYYFGRNPNGWITANTYSVIYIANEAALAAVAEDAGVTVDEAKELGFDVGCWVTTAIDSNMGCYYEMHMAWSSYNIMDLNGEVHLAASEPVFVGYR